MVRRSIHLSVIPNYRPNVRLAWLRQVAKTALGVANASDEAAVGIVITDDTTLRDLNLRFRGIDEVTDVLSFNMISGKDPKDKQQGEDIDTFPDAPGEQSIDGEVIISYPQAIRQAKEHGVREEEEIALLVVHGILHLLGHDHMVPSEEVIMKTLEAQALSQVFAPAAVAQGG